MGIRVNFTDVQAFGVAEAVPAGWYTVKPTDFSVEVSGPQAKNPGSQYIKWTLTIQDEGPYQGKKIFNNTSLIPAALGALKGFIQACGQDADGEFNFEPESLIGTDVMVRVTQREYNGDKVNDVKGFKPVGDVQAGTSVSTLP